MSLSSDPHTNPVREEARRSPSAPSGTPHADPSRSVPALVKGWRMSPDAFDFSTGHTVLPVFAVMLAILLVLAAVLLIGGRNIFFAGQAADHPGVNGNSSLTGGIVDQEGPHPFADGASGPAKLDWNEPVTVIPAEQLDARNAALADLTAGKVIASRKADERIYPASMTKVMTLIVIAENLPDEAALKQEITISHDVYRTMHKAGASGIGMEAGEVLSVESLIYALVLRSDGIAACELARFVAGSEEHFTELMNRTAARMGLTDTHFVNPTGLFHPEHYSTCREIASIMAYAMNMSFPRRVLTTDSYEAPFRTVKGDTKTYTIYHNLKVTLFDKYKPNQPSGMTVLAGKTGFTDESRYCLVTYLTTSDGHPYVCVTAKGTDYHACIKDYIKICENYR